MGHFRTHKVVLGGLSAAILGLAVVAYCWARLPDLVVTGVRSLPDGICVEYINTGGATDQTFDIKVTVDGTEVGSGGQKHPVPVRSETVSVCDVVTIPPGRQAAVHVELDPDAAVAERSRRNNRLTLTVVGASPR